MKKYIFLSLVLFALLACKNDDKKEVDETTEAQTESVSQDNMNSSFPDNPIVLQDPCTLIELEEVSKIFDIDASLINIKPGSQSQGAQQKNNVSCFYTWNDGISSGGFLLQLMKNPLYGEFDNWASSYIETLGTNGETSFPDNIQYKYTPLNGLGDGAVYNEALGKVYWRLGEEMVVGLIFRNSPSVESIVSSGKEIGTILKDRIEIKK
jgi:hypothetical protein